MLLHCSARDCILLQLTRSHSKTFQSHNGEASLVDRKAGDDSSTGEDQDEKDLTENQCAICLMNFDKGVKTSTSLLHQCHEFHHDCLTAWLVKHDDCPCCRRPFIAHMEQQKESERQSPYGDLEAPGSEETENDDDRESDTERSDTAVLRLETGSDD